MKTILIKTVRFFSVVLLCAIISCRLESAMDRFGSQIIESMDDSTIPLVEVKADIKPPDNLPCSDEMSWQMAPVNTPLPPYPERLRKKRVEGKASVMLVTDSSGAIISSQIVYATDTSLASAMMQAVKNWKVNTCMENNRPVPCYKVLTVDFELE
jgi:TonB family protein